MDLRDISRVVLIWANCLYQAAEIMLLELAGDVERSSREVGWQFDYGRIPTRAATVHAIVIVPVDDSLQLSTR
jgi:hypothetical protein